MDKIRWNRDEVNVDNIFAYNIALYVIDDNEDHKFKSLKDYKKKIADGKRQF